ncbi:MAG: DegT/DnrJ/EryC1/StrS family aminotransferase [Phycisphaerae bacterium]|jgi:dTDP-4-amino-4,6-dideoxygalactose transaminase
MSPQPDFIPVARPWLDDAEAAAAGEVIRSGWVTQGPQVAAFEREFAEAIGATHACAVSSCTTALHLALLAVGVQPGDEVVTASHSFIAGANAIRYCGAIPVFVDIEPGTFNLDPRRLSAAIGPKTRAILAVHQMGMPCDLPAILEIAARHKLPVVEDAACAIGSEIRWQGSWERIGRPRGDVACFSFHPRKLLTTGDGGMLTTANAEYDARFRLLRHQGMSVSDAVRHKSSQVIFETYPEAGFNYRLTDIQAAVGRQQLRRLDEIIARRRELAAVYHERLAVIPGLGLPVEPPWARSNWQSYCVRLPNGCDQVEVMQQMLDAGVATRRGVMCSHRESAYPRGTWSCGPQETPCDCAEGTCRRLAESEAAQDRCIILPLFHEMTAAQQQRVVAELHEACRAGVAAVGARGHDA